MVELDKKYKVSTTFGVKNHKAYYDFMLKNAVPCVPHFLIMKNGDVIEYTSESDVILLEDVGPLHLNEENEFVDYLGTIYKDTTNIVNILWRGYEYWEEISDLQIKALEILIKDRNINFNTHLPIPNPTLKLKIDGR